MSESVGGSTDDTHAVLRQTVRNYALKQLLPNYRRWDEGVAFPREAVASLAALGLLGMRVPVAYGGSDASYVECGIVAEELARGDVNCTLFLQIHAMVAEVLRLGEERTRSAWLPSVASGDRVFALAITEPDSGSDASALKLRAVAGETGYVLDGEKASITFAGFADAAIVFARTGGEGPRGISSLLVELAGNPRVSRSVTKAAGERLSQRGSLFFDGAAACELLGEEGTGFYQAMSSFDFNRAIIGLATLGAASQSLDETVAYARQRRAFGKPLASFQGVSFQLAEHYSRVEAARLLCYQAMRLRDAGQPHTKEMAMAKWLAPNVATSAIHSCIILNGHYGYSQELYHEQRLRDVIGMEIGDGTPEIMKMVIAREIFGREVVGSR